MAFDRLEAFQQRLLWKAPSRHFLYEVATEPGPNRLAELSSVRDWLEPVPRFGILSDDLGRLMSRLYGTNHEWEFAREKTPMTEFLSARESASSSRHLVRLWTLDEVGPMLRDRHEGEAVAMAGLYQLVTPVSGAVVLDNAREYEQVGLAPVDAYTVPTVPEPKSMILICLGCLYNAFIA